MLRRTAFRLLAGALILGAVVHVVTLWPRVEALAQGLDGGSWIVVGAFVVSALTALVACGLAGLLLWRADERPDARALILFLALLALFWGSLFRFVEVAATSGEVSVNVSYGGGWTSQSALAAFLLTFAAFLRFSALFPQRLTAERLPKPRLERFRLVRAARRLRVAFLRPAVVWGSAALVYGVQRYLPDFMIWWADIPEGAEAAQIPQAVLLAFLLAIVLMAAYAVFAMTLGALNLRTGYRIAEPEEKRRALWVFVGFSSGWWLVVAAAGIVALSLVLPDETSLVAAAIPMALFIAPLVVVLGAAVGVLYGGAVDPALALERSTVYGILGALGVITFTVLESALSEWVERRVPLPGLVGPIAAGLLVAGALLPVRSLVRRYRRPGSHD